MNSYVASYYLEPSEPVEVAPEPVVERVEAQQLMELAEPVTAPVSDYCGFESEDLPPIYREQLRQLQKEKILAEKSAYAYTANSEVESVRGGAKEASHHHHHQSHHNDSHHYYVPGFSPPQHNDEVHKRNDHSLPKHHGILATEHVFNFPVKAKNEESHYVLMANEEPMSKERTESVASFTPTGSNFTSTEESVLTATLGPPLGAFLHSARSPAAPRSVALSKARGPSHEKYAGLSAFRPVSNPVESAYALPGLNH